MAFDHIIGQETQRQRLMDALMQGRLAHAYLLYGPSGTGVEALAIELAKAVNCAQGPGEPCQKCPSCRKIQTLQHPDLHVFLPSSSTKAAKGENKKSEVEGRSDARLERRIALIESLAKDPYAPFIFNKNDYLSVDDIRGLRQDAYVKPFEGRRKVVIIAAADRMNVAASNALLKTLEEPPGELMLILTTHRMHGLLPTIISRCQPVHLGRLPESVIQEALITRYQTDPDTASAMAKQSDGSLNQALQAMSEEGTVIRKEAFSLLECIHGDHPLQIFEMVDHLTAMHRKTPVVEPLLDALLSYYRDLFILTASSKDTMVIHIDRLDAMKDISRKITMEQIEVGIQDVEEIKQSIIKNVHLQLALTVLALRLRGRRAQAA